MTRARAAGLVLLLAAVAACWLPGVARATEVSAEELRSLAREARDSPGALAELRRVTSVDGRRVNVREALQGARGEALDRRLETLERSITDAGGAPARDARRDAREVLAEERFHGGEVPGPFRGLLERLGRLVPDFEVPLDWLDDLLPGPRSVVWGLLAAVIAMVAWLLARRVLSRRVRAAATTPHRHGEPGSDDPRTLDRRAAEAEAAGDLETALRLRFRAGLLRLDARGAIAFRPSISTHEVRRALRSDDFDALARTFDDVVYGGRDAHGEDVADARERWPAVLDAARRRERERVAA